MLRIAMLVAVALAGFLAGAAVAGMVVSYLYTQKMQVYATYLRRSIFNRLVPFAIGEGRNQQVVIHVSRVREMLEISDDT